MRLFLALFGFVLLCGCSGEVEHDASEAEAIVQTADPARFEVFQRLPEKLSDAVVFRKERHDRLVLDEMFSGVMTEKEFLKVFLDYQSQIERVIDATLTMTSPIPPAPDFGDDDIQNDRHLDTVPGRLLNNSRLLLADAIRCWEIGKYKSCGRRYAASMRIGLCMLDDVDTMTQIRGAQVCIPTILELDLRLADGLAERLTEPARGELLNLILKMDTSRVPGWDDSSPVAEAKRRAIRYLEDGR